MGTARDVSWIISPENIGGNAAVCKPRNVVRFQAGEPLSSHRFGLSRRGSRRQAKVTASNGISSMCLSISAAVASSSPVHRRRNSTIAASRPPTAWARRIATRSALLTENITVAYRRTGAAPNRVVSEGGRCRTIARGPTRATSAPVAPTQVSSPGMSRTNPSTLAAPYLLQSREPVPPPLCSHVDQLGGHIFFV